MGESQLPQRRDRPPRLDAALYGHSGYANHINVGTYGGEPHFARHPELAAEVARCLRAAAEASGVQVLCYCVMPSHLHLVAMIEPGGKTLNLFVQSIKKRSTLAARQTLNGPLWQRGFYDSFIDRDKALLEVCLYVLNNPVKAGIVKDWREYPHSWLSPELGT